MVGSPLFDCVWVPSHVRSCWAPGHHWEVKLHVCSGALLVTEDASCTAEKTCKQGDLCCLSPDYRNLIVVCQELLFRHWSLNNWFLTVCRCTVFWNPGSVVDVCCDSAAILINDCRYPKDVWNVRANTWFNSEKLICGRYKSLIRIKFRLVHLTVHLALMIPKFRTCKHHCL